MSEWISVKDRLPDTEDYFLVYPYRYGAVLNYSKYPTKELPKPCFCYDEHVNGDGWYSYQAEGITHWMPLPDPPKLEVAKGD